MRVTEAGDVAGSVRSAGSWQVTIQSLVAPSDGACCRETSDRRELASAGPEFKPARRGQEYGVLSRISSRRNPGVGRVRAYPQTAECCGWAKPECEKAIAAQVRWEVDRQSRRPGLTARD